MVPITKRNGVPGVGTFVTSIVEALDPVTGRITVATALKGITVRCGLGVDDSDGDWLEIQRQDLSLPIPNWITVYKPTQFTITPAGRFVDVPLQASAGGIPDGQYLYRHLVYGNSADDNGIEVPADTYNFSAGARLRSDRVAPWGYLGARDIPPASTYTGSLPSGQPLTQSVINADGGLPFTLPNNDAHPYLPGRYENGDTYRFYFSQSLVPQPADMIGTQAMQPTGNTFTVPASVIVGANGPWHFYWEVVDASGNVSRPSAASTFALQLVPAPNPLPLFLPLAPDATDNELNIADYVKGIEGQILAYANALPGTDKFQLRVGQEPFTTVSAALASFPFKYEPSIVNSLLFKDWGGASASKPTEFQYRIVRGNEEFLSPIKTVNVNFSVPGPQNPGEPGTRNPVLNQAHIFGEGSAMPDVLEAVHANKNITVRIMLPPFQGSLQGLFIHVVGNDGIAVQPPFPITNQLPGNPVEFTLPWTAGLIKFNGPQNIHYFLARSATPAPDENVNRAPDTPIQVNDAVMVPLTAPEFIRSLAGPPRNWTCSSYGPRPQVNPPVYYADIKTAPDDRYVLNSTMTLYVRVFNARGAEIPTYDKLFSYSQLITAQVKASGHTFRIPYEDIKLARLGRIDVTLVAPLAGNISGRGNGVLDVRTSLSTTYCDGEKLPNA